MFALFNRFELSMTLAQARQGSHQGRCDEDVAELLKLPHIRRQLKKLDDATLAAELGEYGAWEEDELKDRAANEARVVWLAAGNIVEDYYERRREPCRT
jgi:hypothetical protein